MKFITRQKVRFRDVDPAGIVFYPRYFEMLNGAVEDWFAEALGASFSNLHLNRGLGAPTVKLECEFRAPSVLGEELEVSVEPVRVGVSSCAVEYRIECGGQLRMSASGVLVCMDLKTRAAVPWPDGIRARLTDPQAA